jgi:hypothetical protein
MLTLKLYHPNGQKEVAHFQTMDKCVQWMNLHSKHITRIDLHDSKSGKTIEFKTKREFEDYNAKQAVK